MGKVIFTARIQWMTGIYVFSLSTIVGAGTLARSSWRGTLARSRWGYPDQVQMGGGVSQPGTPSGPGMRYPPIWTWDSLPPPLWIWTWDGVSSLSGSGPLMGYPLLGQQKEYSLRNGQYASCIHAGGLSCFSLSVHTWGEGYPSQIKMGGGGSPGQVRMEGVPWPGQDGGGGTPAGQGWGAPYPEIIISAGNSTKSNFT